MQRKYVPFAVLFVILLVIFTHLGAKMTAVPVFTYAEETKELYLTFDDGPSTRVTERVLDTLKAENIKATFFIVSDRVEGREETLRRIAAEGHSLGVHSKTHDYNKIYASDEAFLADVNACAKVIFNVTGVTPHLYRFPGGYERERRTALLTERGYRVVGWNAVCGDGETLGADAGALVKRAVSTAEGKEPVILLLHDSAHHTSTAEALPQIIAHFRKEGYVFRAF